MRGGSGDLLLGPERLANRHGRLAYSLSLSPSLSPPSRRGPWHRSNVAALDMTPCLGRAPCHKGKRREDDWRCDAVPRHGLGQTSGPTARAAVRIGELPKKTQHGVLWRRRRPAEFAAVQELVHPGHIRRVMYGHTYTRYVVQVHIHILVDRHFRVLFFPSPSCRSGFVPCILSGGDDTSTTYDVHILLPDMYLYMYVHGVLNPAC